MIAKTEVGMQAIQEHRSWRFNGFLLLLVNIALLALIVVLFRMMILENDPSVLWSVIPLLLVWALMMSGFFVVQPNEARVLVFFGRYVGTVRDAGFWWSNPFAVKKHVSLRIHNFNSEKIKVNDLQGNPIEIAAVVVWRVVDSARALFDVENYQGFVDIQSETAIRTMAAQYPYDAHDDAKASLRGSPKEVSEKLRTEVQARLEIAGVEISEARISHLAYAQEIAQAMLRRQQAEAIVAARQKIVEGAVGMVESALKMLSDQHVVELDEEKKATMVNNLLVSLVSDRETQPVINTGTLYQ
jgi:regulator of protease activity HflC (stomatin/prohibitin superfamily)